MIDIDRLDHRAVDVDRAERQQRDPLRAAGRVDLVDAEQRTGGQARSRSGQPSLSRCGGEVTAIARTPATCAGTTFITTLDGYSARPPGTYSPTRRTGTQRWVTVPPGAIWVTFSVGNCAAWPTLARAIDSVSAARTGRRHRVERRRR